MFIREGTKEEIETKLEFMGEYNKIDYLKSCLAKRELDSELKAYVSLKLSELYEKKGMLKEAARYSENAANTSGKFNEKIQGYMKEAGLLLKQGDYESFLSSFKRALSYCNELEQIEMKNTMKDFCIKQAEANEFAQRSNNAAQIYHVMLAMNMAGAQKQMIQRKLVELYTKLGKPQELRMMQAQLEKEKESESRRAEEARKRRIFY